MALETVHNIDKGISRLYCSPTDFDLSFSQGAPTPLDKATPAHRLIFKEYLEALKRVYPIAEAWWSSLIDAQMKEAAGHRPSATEAAFLQRIAGPASDPQFVALIREFWLRVAAQNASLVEADRVPPQVLLLGWLVETGESDFVRIVTCMPYWPIGLDEKGNWC